MTFWIRLGAIPIFMKRDGFRVLHNEGLSGAVPGMRRAEVL